MARILEKKFLVDEQDKSVGVTLPLRKGNNGYFEVSYTTKDQIKSNINVTMIHGSKDEVVPTSYSRKVLKLFTKANKKLVIIKNGDHSLSNKRGLKRILLELDKITSNVV